MSKEQVVADLRANLESLQQWFAAKPYGWRERATAGMLQQWADREREQEGILARLEMMGE
jgi:hypothetical protein